MERLIAGPNGVFICNECVALCNQIIDTEHDGTAQGSGDGTPQGETADHR